jgi:hypothetical protein
MSYKESWLTMIRIQDLEDRGNEFYIYLDTNTPIVESPVNGTYEVPGNKGEKTTLTTGAKSSAIGIKV